MLPQKHKPSKKINENESDDIDDDNASDVWSGPDTEDDSDSSSSDDSSSSESSDDNISDSSFDEESFDIAEYDDKCAEIDAVKKKVQAMHVTPEYKAYLDKLANTNLK